VLWSAAARLPLFGRGSVAALRELSGWMRGSGPPQKAGPTTESPKQRPGESGQSGDGRQRVAAFAPGVQAALQGPNAGDALFSEEQRHTGAGGFVWSSTVKNDVAVAGQLVVLLLQFLGIHTESAGDSFRLGFKIHVVA
jgi:hypothetical protein